MRAASLAILAASLGLGASPAVARPLEELAVVRNHDGGLDAIGGASAVVVAAGGEHVYVAGSIPGSVAAFARDAGTGALSLVDVERDGVGGVDGLAGANALALSPDGAFLYVAGSTDHAIAIFARDPATGALTFVDAETGLVFPGEIAISPDGAFLYAVAGTALFARDADTGSLSLLSTPSAEPSAALAIDPTGSQLFVASRSIDGSLDVDSLDPLTGASSFVASYGPSLFFDDYGCCDYFFETLSDVVVSADGGFVYVAASSGYILSESGPAFYFGSVTALSRDAETGALSVVDQEVSSPLTPDPIPGLDGVNALALSADGTRLYAAAFVDSALVVFDRDPATGALSHAQTLADRIDVEGLDGALGVAVDPATDRVYAASADDDTLLAFDLQPAAGDALAEAARFEDGGVTGLAGAFSIAVSRDGLFVYASGLVQIADSVNTGPQTEQPPASIAVFARDPATGLLTFVEEVEGLDDAAFTLAPVTDALFALGPFGLRVYARDPTTGTLVLLQEIHDGVDGVDSIADARFLVVSPDERDVYVSSPPDAAITRFQRDPATGLLSQADVYETAVGVTQPDALAFGPAAQHLYVGDAGDLLVLARDSGNGALSFVEREPHAPGQSGLQTIAVRGTHVYVTFLYPDGVLQTYDRDPVTGALSFATESTGLLFSTPFEVGPRFIRATVLPDESTLYLSNGLWRNDYGPRDKPGWIRVFSRDPVSGALSLEGFEETAKLGDIPSVALSPDGAHLYAASTFTDELVIYATPEPDTSASVAIAIAALEWLRRRRGARLPSQA